MLKMTKFQALFVKYLRMGKWGLGVAGKYGTMC